MTPRELADALESMAEEPTLGIALSSGDVAELRLAAQTLRALETERATARAEQAEAERDELRARFAEMTTKADAWSYAARALERADQAEAEVARLREQHSEERTRIEHASTRALALRQAAGLFAHAATYSGETVINRILDLLDAAPAAKGGELRGRRARTCTGTPRPTLPPSLDTRDAEIAALRTRLAAAEAERDALGRSLDASASTVALLSAQVGMVEKERDRYRSALRDVAREWPYLDLIDPQTAQECDLRGLVEYLLGALRSEQRVAREALEGHTDE